MFNPPFSPAEEKLSIQASGYATDIEYKNNEDNLPHANEF